MDAYIYAADIYCEDCGQSIRERLDLKGSAPSDPDDEASYDSDQYPQGPFDDGGGEADCPQHCGSHGDCLNAIELKDGRKVGAFLENPLTSDGVAYVEEKGREDSDSEVVQLWCDHYGIHCDTPDDKRNRARFDVMRMADGKLRAFAEVGGYPIYYLCEDNGVLCPGCANGENGSEASPVADTSDWRLAAYDVHWEGEPLTCDHCGASIESAYGPVESESSEA